MKNIVSLIMVLFLLAPLSIVAQAQDKISFSVAGKCEMCKDRIEEAVKTVKGIEYANWSEEENRIHIKGKNLNQNEIEQAIVKVGHDTENIKADDKVYANLHHCCKYRPLIDLHAKKSDVDLNFRVAGKCEMCKDRIEEAVKTVHGVEYVNWSEEENRIQVKGRGITQNEIEKAIVKVGHDTENIRADDEVYENLHHCCKYRPIIDLHPPKNDLPFKVEGQVVGVSKKGKEILSGANVYWLGTISGVATDSEGRFSLPSSNKTNQLVVSFVGFQNDTIAVTNGQEVKVELIDELYLDEVNVVSRRKSTAISHISAIKSLKVSDGELEKAACCNLSESFETNPTVDVSFTDAVTGTRQIQMLGLAGPYVQIMRESVPDVRGLSAINGLTFTPGTWVESIQLNLGAGSVANGYESVTGQINVELKKPENAERLYLNLFSNHVGAMEANLNLTQKINDRWSTGLLLHGKYFDTQREDNNDGFIDQPLSKNLIALNRWKYNSGKALRGQFGIKVSSLESLSGQKGYSEGETSNLWGADMQTRRIEGWGKIGFVSQNRKTQSLGLQLSALRHEQTSMWGSRNFDATQSTLYANLMFQDVFGNTDHRYRLGASFLFDKFDEEVSNVDYKREEIVPGAFFEYTYTTGDKFTAVAGLRGDHHNQYGFFATPRLHLRYAPLESTVFRTSVGRGQRTASIFAENIGAFASNRQFVLHSDNSDKPYGMDAEVAWNFGFNATQTLKVAGKELVFGLDVFHTRFQNQIVVDYETNVQQLHFYNLDGKSYANSIQAQVDIELLPRWSTRLAYRFNDVWVEYSHGLKEKPLTNRFRAFLNTGYETESGWKFDLTANWLGQKRIPDTGANPEEFQLEERSPEFMLFNAQISKKWKQLEVYVGGENLFNYRQDNPILSANNPQSEFFDASLVWGPVMGSRFYAGLRYRIK